MEVGHKSRGLCLALADSLRVFEGSLSEKPIALDIAFLPNHYTCPDGAPTELFCTSSTESFNTRTVSRMLHKKWRGN